MKIKIKIRDKYFALSNLTIYYTWKNIKRLYKSNKFTISARTWNGKSELPVGLYSVLIIQYHFKFIIAKHEIVTDNPLKTLKYFFGNNIL